MGPDEERIMCNVMSSIMAAYERKHGANGYRVMTGDEYDAFERQRVENIEKAILSNPTGSSSRLAPQAG